MVNKMRKNKVKQIKKTDKQLNKSEATESTQTPSVHEDDQDAPTESCIGKDEPTIPSKVATGPICDDIPYDRILHINKLPKKCKVIDIVEVFAEYGPIDTVHIQEGLVDSTANISFKNANATTLALSANKKLIKGSPIVVTMKQNNAKKIKKANEKASANESRDRSVYVKFLKRGTTEEQLKLHFSSCGDVENVRVIIKNSITYAFVTFSTKEMVADALALHNSVLNGNTIGVFESSVDAAEQMAKRDPTLTVMLRNNQHLEHIEGKKIESIFKKCGEIESMDVICRKNCLAFITFKSPSAVEKAFELNGKTVEDIALEVVAYNPEKPKTSIFIINIARDVNEEDLRNHFSKSGDISSVILKKGFAIIHFKDSDGYCKSFLQNESLLKGQMIFLEPYSFKKNKVLKFKQNQGKKRPSRKSNDIEINHKRTKNE
ncbi:modulo [Haematobia irritans]|uniref:modulo n=1 Tax=Haematobia irritans TaxID=7368 RepID=UPI003F5012AD